MGFLSLNSSISKMDRFQHGGLLVVAAILASCVIYGGQAQSSSSQNGRHIEGRIIGGKEILISATPYVVSLRHNGSHVCGGCIISARCVATAAHCCQVDGSIMTINAGSSYSNVTKYLRSVTRVSVHPLYKAKGGIDNDYDCCVLTLNADLDLSTSDCKMVALADNSVTVIPGEMATVSGWGLVYESGKVASVPLMTVQVPIVNKTTCSAAYSPAKITDRMLCAGQGGKDSCQGDSGGPLVNVNGTAIGLVSWGTGCGQAGYPGIYCYIPAVVDWLLQQCSGAKTASVVAAARLKKSQAALTSNSPAKKN